VKSVLAVGRRWLEIREGGVVENQEGKSFFIGKLPQKPTLVMSYQNGTLKLRERGCS